MIQFYAILVKQILVIDIFKIMHYANMHGEAFAMIINEKKQITVRLKLPTYHYFEKLAEADKRKLGPFLEIFLDKFVEDDQKKEQGN